MSFENMEGRRSKKISSWLLTRFAWILNKRNSSVLGCVKISEMIYETILFTKTPIGEGRSFILRKYIWKIPKLKA